MKTKETTDWGLLLSTRKNQRTMTKFATGALSASDTTRAFAHTDYAGEFRRLIRSNGTQYV